MRVKSTCYMLSLKSYQPFTMTQPNGIVEKRITECRNPLKEALIRKEGGLSH